MKWASCQSINLALECSYCSPEKIERRAAA
jgi:hypothetical protein